MGSAIVYHSVRTSSSYGEVRQAARSALTQLGGMMTDTSTGFHISQGTIGTSFGFTANLNAEVTIRQSASDTYDISCALNWTANGLVWTCMIVGFFIFGILWLVGLFYLFFSPAAAYQQALNHIDSLIPGGVSYAPAMPAAGYGASAAAPATVYAPAGAAAAVSAPAATVRVNGQAVTTLPLTRGVRYTVGRNPGSSVIVNDPMVSGMHAVLQVHSNGRMGVYDAGSTNGTFVNGSQLTGEHILGPGDAVTLGSSNCRLTVDEA